MVEVRVRVPAKVNLHLAVGALRPDGYHELITVFHAVNLYDEVIATAGDGISLTIHGAAELASDATNLAWQAAARLADHAGVAPDVHLELHKTIPIAGGMAGGSADAAATLLACSRLWDVTADLSTLAAGLGSDVAFSLLGGTALGTGRGERLTPVPTAGELHWIFAVAPFGISTPEAYGELDRLRAGGSAPPPLGAPDALLEALAAGDLERVAAGLGNDLQPAALALRPELADTLAAGIRHGALTGLVSGSGPTCAFLCPDAATAARVAAALPADGGGRAARPAVGPTPGARVIG